MINDQNIDSDSDNDNEIDFNTEYKEHKRCMNCNKPTNGIEDFKNIHTGKLTKTCKKCRENVYASFKKKPRNLTKPPKKDTQIYLLKQLIKKIDKDEINQIIDNDKELKCLKSFN